jgi:hypothetical protein
VASLALPAVPAAAAVPPAAASAATDPAASTRRIRSRLAVPARPGRLAPAQPRNTKMTSRHDTHPPAGARARYPVPGVAGRVHGQLLTHGQKRPFQDSCDPRTSPARPQVASRCRRPDAPAVESVCPPAAIPIILRSLAPKASPGVSHSWLTALCEWH